MLKKYIAGILLITAVFSLPLYSQEAFPKIDASDIDGIKINRTEYYDGSSLWGYIDGGADLYLEYGFVKIAAQEVLFAGSKYKVDIYKMDSPEHAYGIFSVSRFRCSDETLTANSCVTQFQVLAAKGFYYISIINENGTAEESKFTKTLAAKLLAKIKADDFNAPAPFVKLFKKDNIKFVNGILAVQNSLADFEPFFSGIKKFSAYYSELEENGKTFSILQVTAGGSEDIKTLKENIKANSAVLQEGMIISVIELPGSRALVVNSNMTEENREKLIKEFI